MDPSPPQWLSITGQPLDLNLQEGFLGKCSPLAAYEILNQLGEGTYGVVSRARDTRSSKIVALKQVRIETGERANGIPITALREISILQSLKHANIVNVLDVAVGQPLDEVHMVMEYAEQVKFRLSEVKCLFRQLLEGLDYLHRNDIIHRDVKMQNLLLTAKGVLKLADFGMARSYSPRPLTGGVVTIWYRAPELLLGTRHYTPAVDLYSAGLVLGELLLAEPVLPGETALSQLSLTVKLLGSPDAAALAALHAMGCPQLVAWRRDGALPPGRADNLARKFEAKSTAATVRVLAGLLQWDPRARWTAAEALGRARRVPRDVERWWAESPRALNPELLPTFPEVRNREGKQREGGPRSIGEAAREEGSGGGTSGSGYVFDFEGEPSARRLPKRRRAW